MKRIIPLVFMLLAAGVFAQSVDEAELKKRALDSVQFVNYVGPHRVINTREEILAIGRSLSQGVKTTDRFTLGDKYAVRRFYLPDQEGLSADVLMLLPGAGVDHIRNLNAIVAGYLGGTFGYTEAQSVLLADFITRYNVLLRDDLQGFGSSYAPGVRDQLKPESAGLSRVFSEWPGRSHIVIPLMNTLSKGPRGLVNSDEISGPAVTQPLTGEPGGLDLRKDLTNLKEQEIAQEQRAVEVRQQELEKKEEQIQAQETQLQQLEQAAQKDPAVAQATAEKREELAQTIQEEKKELAVQQEDLAEKKEQLEAREENLTQERQEVAQAQREQTQPQNLAGQDSSPAAATTPAAVPQAATETMTVLTITDPEGVYSQFRMVDLKTGKTTRRSALNSIRGRQFALLGTSFLAIAGRSEGSGTVKLVLLDSKTLELQVEGKEEIAGVSQMVVQGQEVWAVFKKPNGDWGVGLFNAQLGLVAASEESVLPGTLIQVRGTGFLVQNKAGRLVQLNQKTLKKEGEFGD